MKKNESLEYNKHKSCLGEKNKDFYNLDWTILQNTNVKIT